MDLNDLPEPPVEAAIAEPPATEPVAALPTSAEPEIVEPPAQVVAQSGKHSHALPVVLAVVSSLIFGGAAGLAGGYFTSRYLSQPSAESRQIEIIGDSTEEIVAAAAAAALPSVVNIDVSGEQASSDDLPSDHPSVPLQGEGSGVAYKEAPDGGTYIITNNHVIEDATQIVVTDSLGERYVAQLIGGDRESDIAVVLVSASIPTIELGDSDEVVVGQVAIAIGSPFGLEHSVASGVISAVQRSLTDFGGQNGEYPYVNSIQTDAAINPGNSGGALVDRLGRLIGIPSAIYTDTGASDGVGLAIPVSQATRAAEELIEKGRVDTPFLGVLGQTVTPEFASQEGLPVENGAYVVEVTEGTEAEKSGVLSGDVIVAVDEDRIRSMDDLITVVRRRTVGQTVTLTIWRNGEKTSLDMIVGVKPQNLSTQ
ncbi:MAG: trypsin-like peptidase domain-containing protein [Coriobacteriia bacterium]|nr:trypsin-like peptidase domain-containing protein [Coriobacteriia bacterium]